MVQRGPVFTPWGNIPEPGQDWIGKRDIKERQFEPGDLEVLHKGFEPYFSDDDSQFWVADEQGNRICLADTSGGDVLITLPAAQDVMGENWKIKRTTGGVNNLSITAVSGNIDGTATIGITTQYTCLQIISDGDNFWIV